MAVYKKISIIPRVLSLGHRVLLDGLLTIGGEHFVVLLQTLQLGARLIGLFANCGDVRPGRIGHKKLLKRFLIQTLKIDMGLFVCSPAIAFDLRVHLDGDGSLFEDSVNLLFASVFQLFRTLELAVFHPGKQEDMWGKIVNHVGKGS